MKKFLPSILIFVILAGLFSPVVIVRAQPFIPASVIAGAGAVATNVPCEGIDTSTGQPTPAGCNSSSTSTATNAFQKEIDGGCGASPTTWFNGCILKLFYYTYFQVPSLILYVSAWFFNAMVNLGIQSSVTANSGFIPGAWAVVRDLSNIFFILVLLYVALQTILGLGHETKKVIVRVVIVALLINFSMFFSKIVIDSSNILALVFYNRLQTNESRPIDPSRPDGEKDISGDMWRTFDATRLISKDTIEKLKTTTIDGKPIKESSLPFAMTMGIMSIAGSIMLWAAYAFFIAGLMFIGRLIELWVLIIFSPYAFMSWTIPIFSRTPFIGWDDWSKKIIATSFMAPIFMFFIYLIFLTLPYLSKIDKGNDTTWLGIVLGILIPAIVVMALLLKATEFAKKGGGEFGEMIMKGGKVVGGLAIGAATGGAGMLAAGTLGAKFAKIASDDTLKAKAASGDKGAQRKLALANSIAGSSFDFRQTGLGKFVGSKTGMDFNKGTGVLGLDTKSLEGGRKRQVERKAEAEEEKFKTYKLSGSAESNQKIRNEQYIRDKQTAEDHARENNYEFKEKNFKEDYEKGENLGRYGLDKTVAAGNVNTVAGVNAERRANYAGSLDTKKIEEARTAMGRFWQDFAGGLKAGYTTQEGVTKTAALGAATLGVGLAAPVATSFLGALKGALKPRSTDAEVINAVRKGEDPLKHALHEIAKQTADHGAGSHGEAHVAPAAHSPAPAAHAPAPAAHPPAGGGDHH